MVVFNQTNMKQSSSTPLRETDEKPPLTSFSKVEFHALIDRTSSRLYRLAARFCGNESDAQDIVQESYLRAYRALSTRGFDPRATADTWLYGIVANVSLNWVRDRQRAQRREENWQPQEAQVAPAEAKVALRELAVLLDQLTPEQRAVLVLKELEGLSAKEVAAALEITEGAVEQRLVRARETLREKVRHE